MGAKIKPWHIKAPKSHGPKDGREDSSGTNGFKATPRKNKRGQRQVIANGQGSDSEREW